MPGLELFANQAQTTVSSGGTTAPAAGTSETWTMASSAGFPAASSTASPPTFFRITDLSASSEKMIVTNVSGTTWTVTRGAEGTTPVTHASGFTIQNVVTSASLEDMVQLASIGFVMPSGDTSGVEDTAAINAIIATGGSARLAATSAVPFYVATPLTPSTGASMTGAMPWSASAYDTYGAGIGAVGGTVIKGVSGFTGTAVINMTNATTTQYYGASLSDFAVDCSAISSSAVEGMHVEGAWGACFMSGVMIYNSGGHCLHFETNSTTSYVPDDWHVFKCKFSASYDNCGVYADNVPDSWFTDCESSENQLDNWRLNYSLNTSLTRCKGENSVAGAGFHLGGQGGLGRAMSLTACTTHLNYQDGFLFDTDSSDGATGGSYLLANCEAVSDNQAAGTTYAGYRSNGCPNAVMAVNCYAYGAYYGASQTGTTGGLTFTASSLTGTGASLYDDGTGTSRLVSQSPPGGKGYANVLAYGADWTGSADSTAAIQAAVSAVIAAGGGVVYLPAGKYKVSTTVTGDLTGVPVYIVGDGNWATVIDFYGSGDCLRLYSTSFTSLVYGGGIRGLTIDGTNSSTTVASTGLHAGDLFQYEVDVAVQNFSGFTGSKGIHLDNNYAWTEQLYGRIYATNCMSHVVFDNSTTGTTTSTGSFDRMNLDIYVDQDSHASYDGVVFQGGSYFVDGQLHIGGNFGTSSSALTSAVLRLTGVAGSGRPDVGTYSSITSSRLDIGVECDTGTGANAPYTIYFGTTASGNYVDQCYGAMDFLAASTSFQGSNAAGNFTYAGFINGDYNLPSTYVMNTVQTSYIDVYGNGTNGPAQLTGDANNLLQAVNPQGLAGYVPQSQAAATATIGSNTTETALASLTVPENDPVTGAIYKLHGIATATISTTAPTLTFRLRWGGTSGTVLAVTTAIATTASKTGAWDFEGMVIFTSTTQAVAELKITEMTSGTTESPGVAGTATVTLAVSTTPTTVTVSSAESLVLTATFGGTNSQSLTAYGYATRTA